MSEFRVASQVFSDFGHHFLALSDGYGQVSSLRWSAWLFRWSGQLFRIDWNGRVIFRLKWSGKLFGQPMLLRDYKREIIVFCHRSSFLLWSDLMFGMVEYASRWSGCLSDGRLGF